MILYIISDIIINQHTTLTQNVFVEGAGEVDVDQLSVVQRQTQNVTRKLKVV